jgi:hypothetical protein
VEGDDDAMTYFLPSNKNEDNGDNDGSSSNDDGKVTVTVTVMTTKAQLVASTRRSKLVQFCPASLNYCSLFSPSDSPILEACRETVPFTPKIVDNGGLLCRHFWKMTMVASDV